MKSNFPRRCIFFAVIAFTLLMQSCGSDPAPAVKPGESGFFIVNEGAFGNGNASLSFYDRKADQVVNNIFTSRNGRPLGDQAESMTVFNGKGYIVVQNSKKVEVINADDYASVATIVSTTAVPGNDDLQSPRFFVGISSTKGYVSDWGLDGVTGTVKVVDLNTYKVTKTIATGSGANQMLKLNNLVYVANGGGYGDDNSIKIIDSNTDAITNTITVGDNPNSLQRDKDGNIWVACGGKLVYNADFTINTTSSTKGTLIKLSASNTEVLRLPVDHVTYSTVANLGISPDGATLYYTFDGSIYSMPVTATSLPTTPFKSGFFYGLAIDPFNGNVIACTAPNFSSAGRIDIYDASGNAVKNFQVGIGPNGCAFK
jgi:YVTN family beta-propeller protein